MMRKEGFGRVNMPPATVARECEFLQGHQRGSSKDTHVREV